MKSKNIPRQAYAISLHGGELNILYINVVYNKLAGLHDLRRPFRVVGISFNKWISCHTLGETVLCMRLAVNKYKYKYKKTRRFNQMHCDICNAPVGRSWGRGKRKCTIRTQ